MSEIDQETNSDNSKRQLILSQWGYELAKGFVPYFQYQLEQRETDVSRKRTHHYGAGFSFYPRPHFELSALWDRIQATQWTDSAYLLMHYYF